MTDTLTLTLTVLDYIDPDGYKLAIISDKLVVQVTDGVIHDPSSIDLTYTIGDDNWLADWTGAEWLVAESSLKRLRDRVTSQH